jgi:hypothetical protein
MNTKTWGILFWISLGGVLDFTVLPSARYGSTPWYLLLGAAALGWGWSALFSGGRALLRLALAALTGRPQSLPRTDPRALAEELAALNAQIAQLRDTATSFDVSFDQTLQRLDERLRRVEQQSPYVPARHGG